MTTKRPERPTVPCPIASDPRLFDAWFAEHMDQLRRGARRPGEILPIDMDAVRRRLPDDYEDTNVSDDLTAAECGLEG